jgi:hypothetical protein
VKGVEQMQLKKQQNIIIMELSKIKIPGGLFVNLAASPQPCQLGLDLRLTPSRLVDTTL